MQNRTKISLILSTGLGTVLGCALFTTHGIAGEAPERVVGVLYRAIPVIPPVPSVLKAMAENARGKPLPVIVITDHSTSYNPMEVLHTTEPPKSVGESVSEVNHLSLGSVEFSRD